MSQSEIFSNDPNMRNEIRKSDHSSINGFSFGEKSNFKKKSFNGVA